ncbi:MAG: type II secretion system GspH family protein [Deltaproteobacteria bacterium]|nr:type II secretion system GspH family protein [Deltaproteobacteria bacterium]
MNDKGFTLIELLVTITIIAILASIAVPLAELSAKRSREIELKRNLREIRLALDAYKKAWDDGKIIKKAGASGYPPSLDVLVEGIDDASSPEFGKKLKFLRRIPRDPMNTDAYLPPEKTWGLRSYKSSAEDPEEGEDVFDVYSLSEDTAIDGTPYKKW